VIEAIRSRHASKPVHLLRYAFACFALGVSAGACAQGYLGRLLDDFEEVKSLSQRRQRFELENDVFFRTDRNYTDGVRFGYKYLGLRQYRKPPDAGEGFLPGFNLDPVSSRSARATSCAITRAIRSTSPQHVHAERYQAAAGPDPARRPAYAAWLYFGFYRELFASDGRYCATAWTWLHRPCAQGEHVQTFIHRNLTHSPSRRAGTRSCAPSWAWCFATSTCPAHGSRRSSSI